MSLISFYQKGVPGMSGLYLETYWKKLIEDDVRTSVIFALFPGKYPNNIQYDMSNEFIEEFQTNQELIENVTISFILFCRYLGYTSQEEFKLIRTIKPATFLINKGVLLELWYVLDFMYSVGMKGHAYALLLAVCRDMESSPRLSQFIKTDGYILFKKCLFSVGIQAL